MASDTNEWSVTECHNLGLQLRLPRLGLISKGQLSMRVLEDGTDVLSKVSLKHPK